MLNAIQVLLGLCSLFYFSIVDLALAQAPSELDALRQRLDQVQQSGNLSEALPLAEQLTEAVGKALGENSGDYAAILARQAGLLQAVGRYQEAEATFARALGVATSALGPEHPGVSFVLNDFAMLRRQQGLYSEAEHFYQRALTIREKAFGPDHPAVAHVAGNFAALLVTQGRYRDAEPLLGRAIAITERALGSSNPEVARNLNNLAMLHWSVGRYSEAEPLFKRTLSIIEAALGAEHLAVSSTLNNLALVYQDQGRHAEAEPLLKRALDIREKALGPMHPDVGESANNLAWFYQGRKRYAEAEPLYARAVDVAEKSLGPAHATVGSILNNTAVLHYDQKRYEKAEPLFKRAISVRENALGPQHSDVGQSMYRLARVYHAQKRHAEARALHERALDIRVKSLGPEHPEVVQSLDGIAHLHEDQGNWSGAVSAARRARDLVIARSRRGALEGDLASLESGRRELAQGQEVFARLIRTLWETSSREPQRRAALLRESYLGANWAQQTEASVALAQMSVRQAKGDGPLSKLVRERQDLAQRWQVLDKQLYASIAQASGRNPVMETQLRDELEAIGARRTAIDAILQRDFAEYFAISNPAPISLDDTRKLLKTDEALVKLMVSERDVYVWVVTKWDQRWVRSSIDAKGVSDHAAALRCGLDAALWMDAKAWPDRTEELAQAKAAQIARRERCLEFLKSAPRIERHGKSRVDVLPFDLARAHDLYAKLLGPFEDLIEGKRLLIVAGGPLGSIPFDVLVTRRPPRALPTQLAEYRNVAWLGKRGHAVSMLPSVSSLKALRSTHKPSQAGMAYLGFGNPLLSGPDGSDRSAWDHQECARTSPQTKIARRGPLGDIGTYFRSGFANVDYIRAQFPLPETADELCAVARALGADEVQSVHLGERATEHAIKTLSANGTLAAARVVHFATHGLLAAETERLAASKAEPSLILTPPEQAGDHDDGLLTSSEVAELKLDADWVILSACNTAAGSTDTPGAETLSGLARAFFYAGARALLVSHWAVDSQATVQLVSGVFRELADNPRIGRAEALRRSMRTLRETGGANVHPANWAPFVVVGEGTRVHPGAR